MSKVKHTGRVTTVTDSAVFMGLLLLTALFGAPVYANANANANENKNENENVLFHQAEPSRLQARLELPLTTLIKKRAKKESVTGQLYLGDNFDPTQAIQASDAAAITSIKVDVTPRGKFRLRTCRFPPLSLDFPKKQSANTLLAGQNKLKLVTHCSNSMADRGYLAAEMLTYRLLNRFTDKSFRVRALEITYVDTEKPNDPGMTRYAFLIEHKKQVAKRLGLKVMDIEKLDKTQLDVSHTGLVGLYQYLIGNTDYSMVMGPAGDKCCHNAVPMLAEGGSVFNIPYDFDSSGMVNPSYAPANAQLGLKRLTQRKYRGFCHEQEGANQAQALLLEQRPDINRLIEEFDDIPGLRRKKAQSFVDKFFKIISTPKQYQSKIAKRCR